MRFLVAVLAIALIALVAAVVAKPDLLQTYFGIDPGGVFPTPGGKSESATVSPTPPNSTDQSGASGDGRPKRDLRGIRPGMSRRDVLSIRQSNCSYESAPTESTADLELKLSDFSNAPGDYQESSLVCSDREGTLEVAFSPKVLGQSVVFVIYKLTHEFDTKWCDTVVQSSTDQFGVTVGQLVGLGEAPWTRSYPRDSKIWVLDDDLVLSVDCPSFYTFTSMDAYITLFNPKRRYELIHQSAQMWQASAPAPTIPKL